MEEACASSPAMPDSYASSIESYSVYSKNFELTGVPLWITVQNAVGEQYIRIGPAVRSRV